MRERGWEREREKPRGCVGICEGVLGRYITKHRWCLQFQLQGLWVITWLKRSVPLLRKSVDCTSMFMVHRNELRVGVETATTTPYDSG